MSILVGKDTKVIVQGLTGSAAPSTPSRCASTAPPWSAALPRQGRHRARGLPGVRHREGGRGPDRRQRHVIYVPPPGAADAILEAAAAGIEVVICITEGISTLDMVKAKRALGGYPKVRLVPRSAPSSSRWWPS
jgi:succinyl-CoA synthetase alpha subunit